MIQFDEPCFNVYVDKVKDWGPAALERAARGVAVTKAVHICYVYGTADVKRWKSANTDWSHYEVTLPLLANSTIDQVSVETAASRVDLSVISALRGRDVLLGVVDVGSETVEPAETVAPTQSKQEKAVEVAELLLSFGADPSLRDPMDQTPTHAARRRGFDEAATALEDAEK